jgi:hypothetical protein
MGKAARALLLGLALVACGGGETGPSAPTSGPTDAAPPATPAGPTLAGAWLGTFNEILVDREGQAHSPSCELNYTLRLDLTQSGSNVSGSGLLVVADADCQGEGVNETGQQFALTVSGSVSVPAVQLHLKAGDGGSADLTGTVAGNTMSGTLVTNEGGTGTWSVTR